MLANKWVLYLLSILEGSARPLRFTEIRCRIDGITQKSLTQALRNLERDGLVSRTVYPAIPPHVEYALTDLGLEAGRLTTQIAEWSRANAPRIVAARDHHAQKPSAAFGSPEQR
ncbi:winged helix-turn-helix transcriptional regulator [Amycolatopsis jiangsuensis]|uniref:DNA-binding HxlR family transcriptional regulator n=1 Tax=Amycolatopsis jiangsuensis TaxID=1181879 RepID=A0A840J8Q8_9PSEU|nr:helix-turn-helix domain-containing protein [Amycolatopsis jiangsuensis]MBB4689778.1 DNA-binding HxlR family transcriptional regulator [Amycolatopsis jiangsuensis]